MTSHNPGDGSFLSRPQSNYELDEELETRNCDWCGEVYRVFDEPQNHICTECQLAYRDVYTPTKAK